MTEEFNKQSVVDEQAMPSLGIGDLGAMVQVIDIVSERGAFKGPELETIGILRGRIVRFIEANQKQPEETTAAAE